MYTQFTLYPNMETNNPTHSHKTTLCTYICSIIQIQSVSLQNIINNSTCTNVRRILICSSVRCACTGKLVFKTQNNELNELSECMLYKMFPFSENISKLYNSLLQDIFQKPCFLTLLCFTLKVFKTFHNLLLALKVSTTFHNLLLALKV